VTRPIVTKTHDVMLDTLADRERAERLHTQLTYTVLMICMGMDVATWVMAITISLMVGLRDMAITVLYRGTTSHLVKPLPASKESKS
jgi:hypothetical protein